MQERVFILGVPVDRVTLSEALVLASDFIASDRAHHITTPNPEMLVEAARNPDFRHVLLTSHLNIPDGSGLLWAAKHQGSLLPERVAGVDFLMLLCEKINQPIFFLGAQPGVAERAATALKVQYPHLAIAGTFSGSPRESESSDIVKRINDSGATVLFVAYGAPAQDVWIHRHLPSMPRIRIAMGVGGAFDFIAGVRIRAPKWMRHCHIEWLWRLMQEPLRLKRIFNAVVVFPWMVFMKSLRASSRTL